jgi:hypothetical protein
MTAKKINELTAKTPVSTDVIPVADPVTGIAGKSTIAQILTAALPTPNLATTGWLFGVNQAATGYEIIPANPADFLSRIPTSSTAIAFRGILVSARFGVGGGAAYSSLSSLILSDLTILTSNSSVSLLVSNYSALTYFEAFSLVYCVGGVVVTSCPLLQTLNFRALQNANSITVSSNSQLSSLFFQSLKYCNQDFTVSGCPLLTTMPVIPSSNLIKGIGGSVILTGNALDVSTVDNWLDGLSKMDGTNGKWLYSNNSVNLSGGTNAVPSATGLAAKAILVSRGCTVTHN